jgi:hypothetical protein
MSSNAEERIGVELGHVWLGVGAQSRAAEFAFDDVRSPIGQRAASCPDGHDGSLPVSLTERHLVSPLFSGLIIVTVF